MTISAVNASRHKGAQKYFEPQFQYLFLMLGEIWYQSFFTVLGSCQENRLRKGRASRRRWEDNIKMDLQEVGGDRGDWMELAQDRDSWRALVGTVRNFRVP
jgi:hypothetical protein